MPLHALSAPAPALRSVRTALGSPSAVRGSRAPLALRTAQGPLRPELPLPAYEMVRVAPDGTGRADASAAVAPRTRLTGWRFLLADGGTDGESGHGSAFVGTAEAVPTADGWTFGQFRQGPYVLSTVRALRQAEVLPTPYQPRLLSVPELYMLTLWLHADIGGDPHDGVPDPADLLIPLAPAPPGIAPHTAHRVDTLLPALTRRLGSAAAPARGADPGTAPLLRTPA
ncbi:hypothetical protein AN217_14610 [Streptomyces qinglanensis]|uniref:Uncharacterized protein n=1 Tax=Streptomyces qinglanensis TaxID=943816 RepID=A0A1E7K4L7_9ACTN|nr:hypothetical protein [Streptomyces qinglanensis]OEU98849.1 hypothetical protein AN217_14610 [Streptomyces qinglanensis]OEV25118.1 hypothetical protein AN220_15490 [Streptomyces nanshensis]